MKMKIFAILALLLLAGCTRFRTYTGDFSVFLIDALKSNGASLREPILPTDGLPTHWEADADEDGIVILAPINCFSAIDRILRALWGKPQIWCDTKKILQTGYFGNDRNFAVIIQNN